MLFIFSKGITVDVFHILGNDPLSKLLFINCKKRSPIISNANCRIFVVIPSTLLFLFFKLLTIFFNSQNSINLNFSNLYSQILMLFKISSIWFWFGQVTIVSKLFKKYLLNFSAISFSSLSISLLNIILPFCSRFYHLLQVVLVFSTFLLYRV